MLYALQCEASHRCCRTSGQSTKCSCNCHQYKLSTPVDDLYTAYTCIHIYVYTRSEHSHHNRSIIDEDVFVVAYFYVIRLSCCFAFGSIRCEYAFLPSFYLSTYLLWPKFSFVAQFSNQQVTCDRDVFNSSITKDRKYRCFFYSFLYWFHANTRNSSKDLACP